MPIRNAEDTKERTILNRNNGLINFSEWLDIDSSENVSLYNKDFKKEINTASMIVNKIISRT
ncbi:MAG: hypothetical protein Q7S18_00550 [bacterium]|nr:hypothetical protein [bacterium]